tara:strand:+ start:2704 stop:6057 length:3354 start_codon:yes stop_codon:yes gene_type:complete
MASNSNRVFVSPGVYTSEKDLSFVSQSVGVTTLGLVGETLRGPAFEPIFISSYGDFSTYFGGVSPEKYTGSQIPKYELGYIAKAYLQQSNQLFVTRILGYSGYDAGPSWSILTLGDIDCNTLSHICSSGTTAQCCGGVTGASPTCGSELTSAVDMWSDSSTLKYTDNAGGDIIDAIITAETNDFLGDRMDNVIELYNGSTTTLRKDINLMFDMHVSSLVGLWTGAGQTIIGTSRAFIYGCNNFTDCGSTINYPSGATPVYGELSGRTSDRLSSFCSDKCDDKNDSWTYNFFDYNESTKIYEGKSVTVTISDAEGQATADRFTSEIQVYTCSVTGQTYCEYHDQVIATFRSRGESTLTSGGPIYSVTGTTDVNFDCTGSTWSQVTNDPFANFGIKTLDALGNDKIFEVSMNESSKTYVKKVFGIQPFDRDGVEVPVFVEEAYPKMLTHYWKKGYVRGLRCQLLALPSFREATNTNTIAFYQEQWQTPSTPWLVSELRGFKVDQLFRFITIPDGNAANRAVKLSITNISFDRREFDILVRDFYDTDERPLVLEKYSRCSMNPSVNSYVGKKIGTSDSMYELNSRYIMLEMNPDIEMDDNLWDTLPCGFEGYQFRQYANRKNPTILYKEKYDTPGEIIYNPPFGSSTGSNVVMSGGDKLRKTYLGISDTRGIDSDFFEYHGKQAPNDKCADSSGNDWPCLTQGFHLDMNANCLYTQGELCKTINCGCAAGGPTGTTDQFIVGNSSFSSEPSLNTDPYFKLSSRKFTVAPYGGFDGWDIYRKTRSNGDLYRRGQTGYLNGACITTEYPNASGDGSFKPIGTLNGSTDYYAYLDGIQTFSNPEAVNINIFATPGIDYVNNSNLAEETIEMIETDRADSLYVTTTPDYNMFVATPSDPNSVISPSNAVNNLETVGIDSNYTATYYPWVLNNDTENNVRLFIPPTYEVMRNIALTDNISFPWFASAGYTRGIVNAVKARKKLTLDERDTLYQGRINPIATYSDSGTIIWGNKTLQVKASALDRINVRRLLLQARKLISAVAVRLLFEQNDEQVRNEFLDLVNPILDSIRRERGLTDFRVVLSDDPQLIDQNTLEGKIYVKPTRSLEFISVEFLITPTGASFENI